MINFLKKLFKKSEPPARAQPSPPRRARKPRPKPKKHNVYVVELKNEAYYECRKFKGELKKAGFKPLYVGMTGLKTEERFQNHKRGVKSSGVVKRYGVKLRPDLYEHLNPMTWEDAASMEVELANQLREKGYAVHQA